MAKAQADLLKALKSVSSSGHNALNDKLADYVFFPLSHVLKQYQKLPSRVVESCLECVLILLRTAWKARIEPKLGMQLLILLTILADPDTKGEVKAKRTEEFQIVIYDCFAQVLQSLSQTKEGRSALLDSSNVPSLGKAVYELLDGLSNGPSQHAQLAALSAVREFIDAIDDREALSMSFLPGIVSAFQKILVPSTSSPRSFKISVGCLDALSSLLVRVLGDNVTVNLPAAREDAKTNGHSIPQLDQSWLNATVSQIKMVLATIVKLRSHTRAEVRDALARMCISLITSCRKSLSESMPFLIETIITLATADEALRSEKDFVTLLGMDNSLADLLQTSLYSWVVSLPRVMQSQDESAKQKLINQISTSFRIMSDLGLDTTMVDRTLASHLRDSVVSAMQIPISTKIQDTGTLADSNMSNSLVLSQTNSTEFDQLTLRPRASEDTTKRLIDFIRQLSSYDSSAPTAKQVVASISQSEGLTQLASFWTSLQFVRSGVQSNSDLNSFLNVQSTSQELYEDLLEELYSFSLDLVDPSVFEREHDWRMQALALETIAFQATQLKEDFKNELVDALYPIVHLVGSENAALRAHAITCLNIVALACGYADAKDLIFSNVDYLVNAVALKLNTFDILPQAPQVLLMIVKLSGPRLLPYLDDLVESMFAALDAYHGYPKLVETLFGVLLAIAQEGAKTEQLSITEVDENSQGKQIPQRSTIAGLADTLRSLKRKRNEQDQEESRLEEPQERLPEKPWSELKKEQSIEDQLANLENQEDAPEPANANAPDDENSKPPVPKTYSILLKISQLTQHYLTSSSPSLRTSLLALLHATFPALAKHENSFLPLINTLWPVVVSRIGDTEAYVAANALETIACMCMYAGNFMRSRVTGSWDELKKVARVRAQLGQNKRSPQCQRGAASSQNSVASSELIVQSEKQSMGTQSSKTYVEAPTRMLHESFFNLFIAILGHVDVEDGMFDDMLGILTPFLNQRADIKEALERRNEDAVWLVLLRLQRASSTAAEGADVEEEGQVRKPVFGFAAVE